MTRAKRLMSIFVVFSALFAAIATVGLNRLEVHPENKFSDLDYYYLNDVANLILDTATDLDPDYHYAAGLNEQELQDLEDLCEERVISSSRSLREDENFSYLIKDVGNNTEKTSRFDDSVESDDCIYYGTLIYDSQGNLQSEGNVYSELFNYKSASYLDLIYNCAADLGYDTTKLEIVPPTDLQVTIYVPKDIKPEGYTYSVVYSYSFSNVAAPYTMLTIGLGMVLIGIVMLFLSYKELATMQPFKVISKWKLEFNAFWILSVGSILCLFIFYVNKLTISKELAVGLQSLGVPISANVVSVLNFLMYFAVFFLTGIGIFYLKYGLCSGFVRFLKEDTLIGNCILKFHRYFNDYSQYDLDDSNRKLILRAVVVNTVFVIVIGVLFNSLFLSLAYGIGSYLYLIDKAKKLTREYQKVLNRMDSVNQGNFKTNPSYKTDILPSLQEKIDCLQEGFEQAVKEGVRSQNMKTELITNVSHDLKTPLTGIKNYLELLNQEGLSKEEQEEYLMRLNQYTDRLTNLVNDLFEVSKANSGEMKLDTQRVDLFAMMDQVLIENEDIWQRKHLTPVVSRPEFPAYCQLDGAKTVRIFENLIGNASKYALENTRVFIKNTMENGYAKICVQNVSQDPLDVDPSKLTERFVRADQSRHEEGSGLGLAIVKSFCEIQGGSFEIELDGDVFKAIVRFPIDYNEKDS